LIGGTIGILTSILLALFGYGVWRLAWGTLAGEITLAFLFFINNTTLFNKSILTRQKVSTFVSENRKLMKFSRPIIGASVVTFLITGLDNIIVGKMLGPVQLGFYSIAFTWGNICVYGFVSWIGQVFFPTVAKIQDDLKRVQRGYLDALKWTGLIIAPICLGLFALAPQFVENVLGEKWLPAAPALRLLSLYGLLRGLGSIGGSVRKAIGHPEIQLRLGLVFLVIMLIGIVPLTLKWGITGTALSVLIPSVVINIMAFFYTKKLLKLDGMRMAVNILGPSLLAGLTAVFLTLGATIFSFYVDVLLGVFFYSFLLFVFYGQDLRIEIQKLRRS